MADASRAAVPIVGVLLAICTIATLAAWWWPPVHTLQLSPDGIQANGGFAYVASIPIEATFPFVVETDGPGAPGASRLTLSEDGRPLGPPHATHAHMRESGHGMYSHWGGALYFSALDGSDPRNNGRRYVASLRATISPALIFSIAAADLLFLLFTRRTWATILRDHVRVLAGASYLGSMVAAGLLAAGAFGVINPHAVPAKDAALVLDVVRHALIGCILILLQWAVGAGLARLILGRRALYPELALFGYPLGLVASVLLSAVALTLPYGGWLAIALAVAFLAPLTTWQRDHDAVASLAAVLPGFAVLSAAFGCWLALHWHGPTATLVGSPSGDLTFYASTIHALQAHPLGRLNLGNEGEYFGYYNARLPAMGAALLSELGLDSFLFITATVGTIGLFGSGLALHAYALARPNLRFGYSGCVLLVAALIGAGRYPYWMVESPPVADVVPLSIATWFMVTQGSTRFAWTFAALTTAVIGAALSKVTALPTLAATALAGAAGSIRATSRSQKAFLATLIVCVSAFALFLLVRLGPFFFQVAPFGPESYELVFRHNATLGMAWPYLARDAAMILLSALTWRLAPWPIAIALSGGFLLALGFPFLMRINSVTATVLLALLAAEKPERLALARWHAAVAFGLLLPAMVLTDPAGLSTGIAWVVLGGGIWLLGLHARRASRCGHEVGWPVRFATGPAAVVLIGLVLLAVARGNLIPDSGFYRSTRELTPEVRDIWRAVRSLTPPDALIFTDQTGREPNLLGGWNTYALHGQRQIFIANYYQSVTLRNDAEARERRLSVNEEVLTGVRTPTAVELSRQYSGFFAVVSSRRAMPAQWQPVYRNPDWALYEWCPSCGL